MELVFIGDIHGDWKWYTKFIKDLDEKNKNIKTCVVGDFGIGFGDNIDIDLPNHRFIRGNHDNVDECVSYKNSFIPDGTVEDTSHGKMMFIGGAYSIDKNWRIPGLDWWPTEEVSLEESYKLIEKYKETKPSIMVTHDIPNKVIKEVFNYIIHDTNHITNLMFDEMFSIHQPKIWIHGHHHHSYSKIIDNCVFYGLGINQVLGIDFP